MIQWNIKDGYTFESYTEARPRVWQLCVFVIDKLPSSTHYMKFMQSVAQEKFILVSIKS